jgi:hypothetical protein
MYMLLRFIVRTNFLVFGDRSGLDSDLSSERFAVSTSLSVDRGNKSSFESASFGQKMQIAIPVKV